MQFFNPELWSQYFMEKLKKQQEAWDHLNKLDEIRELNEQWGFEHKPQWVRIKVDREFL